MGQESVTHQINVRMLFPQFIFNTVVDRRGRREILIPIDEVIAYFHKAAAMPEQTEPGITALRHCASQFEGLRDQWTAR